VIRPLIVIGPLPPPSHGVSVSTSLVLANPFLRQRFNVSHLDTSDSRSRENIGRWDATNVQLGFRALGRLLSMLQHGPGVVYLPISQGGGGLLRDSLFIHAAKVRGWRVAVHLRGSELHQVYAESAWPSRLWMRATFARIDSLAVMGESVRGTMEGLLAPARIAVVPNGTPDPHPNGALRDDSTVLFLSNLRRRKGVLPSLEAALIVVDRHPSARFVFAGDWEDARLERELRQRAARAADRIQFVGSVDGEGKRRLLLSASVLLFPPLLPEGHPRVVLEAMAAGLPVVTTDRGTIAETVPDGEAGFVLAEPTPDALADRILRLLLDDDLRARMSTEARRRYLERFTQEDADRRLADWLTAVASC
jgi:glycosyltransferase involved in cell wall biosynthesis